VLLERRGDLELQAGAYRLHRQLPLYPSACLPLAEASGSAPAGQTSLSEVALADGCVWGKAEGGWLQICSAEHGVAADRIEPGFNDAPPTQEFVDPPAPNQMMLLSDMVLAWDETWRPILEEYAADEDLLKKDFGLAFKKLTELGCGFEGKEACRRTAGRRLSSAAPRG